MSKYLDERYQSIKPYRPGEQLRGRKIVKLNTNESPYPPPPGVLEAVKREVENLNLYPDISGGILMTELAEWFKVERENIFVGNGSDEILAFIFQSLCQNGAAFANFTYGFYSVYANLYQVNARVISLQEDFSICVDDYLELNKTIFIANPNAPTGLALSPQEIEKILQKNRNSLVVVDEAYVDFGAESCIPLLKIYDNLLVVGTFSKSRSLAGARLGYAVASKELIEDLERIRFSFNPYNVNQMTMAAGTAALKDAAYFKECCGKIMEERKNCMARLTQMGFSCTDSKANFVFVKHKSISAHTLYTMLKQQDILVRWFDTPQIDNYLRITIGSKQQMGALVDAMENIINEAGATGGALCEKQS